jgi:NTF2-related export protein 1/2
VKELIQTMPITKHDVQSFDCHPIPGVLALLPLLHIILLIQCIRHTGSQPPSLLVSVSGNVQHGRGPAGNPPSTPVKSVDGQLRVFSQTFILVPDPTAPPTKTGEVAKYYVGADAMRFVG